MCSPFRQLICQDNRSLDSFHLASLEAVSCCFRAWMGVWCCWCVGCNLYMWQNNCACVRTCVSMKIQINDVQMFELVGWPLLAHRLVMLEMALSCQFWVQLVECAHVVYTPGHVLWASCQDSWPNVLFPFLMACMVCLPPCQVHEVEIAALFGAEWTRRCGDIFCATTWGVLCCFM